MNKIFKVKQNAFGQSVVTSELAKNKGKVASMASILLSSLIATSAIAAPVSIQGTATSKNAVSIGSDSFATAVDGVATGKSSVATGQGFSRDDFAAKVKEVEDLTAAKNAAQSDLNNLNNDKKTNEATQSSLNDQIADATQKIADAAKKIAQKDALTEQKTTAENNQSALDQSVTDAQNALDAILKEGKNVYVNFTDVLSRLNWSSLDGTTQSRDNLANDLKTVIETDFADLKDKYTTDTYRGLIDGYINKQASYTGAVIALDTIEKTISNQNSSDFFKTIYSLTNLNQTDTLTNETYATALQEVAKNSDWYTHAHYWGIQNTLEYNSNYIIKGSSLLDLLLMSEASVKFNSLNYRELAYYNLLQITDENTKNLSQQIMNTLLLYQNSKAQNTDSYLLNLNVQRNSGKYMQGSSSQANFGENAFIYSLKTTDGQKVSPLIVDFVHNYVETLKGFDNSNASGNTITVSIITNFNKLYNQVQDYYNSIDWNDANAVYDLASYKAQMDKTLGDAAKLKQINDVYTNIINEKQKANADQSYIDQQTALLISLKNDVYQTYGTNALKDYTFVINSDRANAELNYSLTDTTKIINQANRGLKLYDKDDALVFDVTSRANELQKELDDAKKAAEDNKAKIGDLENQINDIGLTPAEESAAETKADLEKQLEDAKNKQTEIDNNIADKAKELEDLTKQLENSSLKDLGLRSQAHGSNAFASGNDSIAIGTDTTVTSTDGIAIGRGSEVTGNQSIALGAKNTVSGDKSIAIGVGHTVSGNRSTTIGDPNVISGDDVFVAGNNNNVASNNVMVMGNNITVGTGFEGAVVLGANSTVAAANPTSSIEIQGNTYNFAGTNPTSTVSVGKAGEERQITNVAAGRISETSTDAINGSQLYAVTEALNAIQSINLDDIAAANINTQATVTAGQGITIAENDNANGTKNYAVSAKLGKGLKVDENGAIAATAQPINGGAGVTITTNAQDEAVVNVTGVTTTTDDGKSYTRSDLTKSVGVKGDGKNIRTSTAANGDVQVKLADDIQVNSVSINNGPTINQQGINAANTRITNVQDGVAPTDAVNVRQLNQQGNIINQRIDNLADNVKKNKKRNDAGIASTAAMANIPQVMLAGKSGVGVGVGHRSGQSAIAVGYSRASDNAKHIIKLSVGMDTQSKATLGAGYMYQW